VKAPRESWIDKLRTRLEIEPDGQARVRGLSREEAEQLLDWLETQACTPGEVSLDTQEGFTVRWRPRASG